MKCEYCDNTLYVEKCSCGHYACGEHSMFVGQTLTACIACYEAAREAYGSTKRDWKEEADYTIRHHQG